MNAEMIRIITLPDKTPEEKEILLRDYMVSERRRRLGR